MKRCRNCNTELSEQARFCNKCGALQSVAGSQDELSTSSKQELVDKTHRCLKCESELPIGAQFCTVCGAAQSSKTTSIDVTTSEKQEIQSSEVVDDNTTSSSAPQPKFLIPTRSISPGIKRASSSQESVDTSNHPKNLIRQPVVPSRPIKNEVTSSTVLPQPNSFQSALSHERATSTASINSSSPATPELTKQLDTSSILNEPP